MYSILLKQFFKSRTSLLGLGLTLALGITSLVIGKKFLDEQALAASQVVEEQAAHVERNIALHPDDLGLLFYYLKFTLVNTPKPLASLSIGQRDVHPEIMRVNMLTLEGQKYDTELVNPVNLLFGNMDLSFLIVYVFPLIIIAFTYNLFSQENETGTWRIVGVMAKSKGNYMLNKLLVRISVLMATVLFILIAGLFLLDIPVDEAFLAFSLLSVCYLLFWFSLSYWVVSLQKNSNVNALMLLSIWLTLVVLVPATLNNFITTYYPIPEALSTMIKQRDAYHQKWDTNKRETMEKFYGRYPQFTSYGYPPEEGFNWMWYYAMQYLGDEESQVESQSVKEKVRLREETSKMWAYLIPAMHTQLSLNGLAGTDLSNYMAFLEHTKGFHEQVRLTYYPAIFSNFTTDQIGFEKGKPHFFQESRDVNWAYALLPLLVPILLFAVLASRNKWD